MKRQNQDKLFTLIKTLTRGEKRAFKIFSQRYDSSNGPNISVRLFDAIDKQDEYDEAALKRKFKQEKFTKQFGVAKNHLFNMIIESLRQHDNNVKNARFKIHRSIETAQILHKRGLYLEAYRLVQKSKKLAYEIEEHEYLLILLRLERGLSAQINDTVEHNQQRETIKATQNEVWQIIDNQKQLKAIMQEINMIYRTKDYRNDPITQQKYQQLIQNDLLKTEENALSMNAKATYYCIWMFHHYFHGNPQQAYASIKQLCDTYEESPERIPNHLSSYLSAINNCLNFQADLGLEEEFMQQLKHLKSLPQQYKLNKPYYERRFFEIIATAEINFYLAKKDFSKIVDTINYIENGLRKFRYAAWDIDRKIRLLYGISLGHFLNGQHEKAHHWILNDLSEYDRLQTSVNYICYAKLLSLILYFEEKNWHILPSLAGATQRYLQKHKRLFEGEQLLIKLFKSLKNQPITNNKSDFFYKWHNTYQKISNNTNITRLNNHTYAHLWLKSKVDNKSIKQLIQEEG